MDMKNNTDKNMFFLLLFSAVVFIFRITVSAIYVALWLLFTLCMFELHYSVDLNELNDDDDDDDVLVIFVLTRRRSTPV